jgi:Uncharacterized protein conserved in bacteria (DUF2325)
MTKRIFNATMQQQIGALCCDHAGSPYAGAPIEISVDDPNLAALSFQDIGEDLPNNSAEATTSNVADITPGSRRLRIWELPPGLHCSIIGVCMPIDFLRRLVAKFYGGPCIVGDYEVHSAVVRACGSREPLIDLVQRELDTRYQMAIKRFQSAKSEDAVAALWDAAVAGDEGAPGLAGALWASLTHPRGNDALRTYIGHEIHMIQHQLGGDVRRDVKALDEIKKVSAQRAVELDVARAKLSQLQTQAAQDAQILRREIADTKVALTGVTAQNIALKTQLEKIRQSVKDLDSREKLSQRVDDLAAQNARLKLQITELNAKRAIVEQPASAPEITPPKPAPRVINLHQKSVLCVGGRSGAVSSYRDAVERAGGKFMHHDGGIEHNQHRLDANLAAADCVICQTGCISHTAYWCVKDYCKKTGKRCVYLDKPSVSTFVEGLSALPFEHFQEANTSIGEANRAI